MILRVVALALLLQGGPAGSPQTSPKGSISGTAVHSATGDPIPNVRVTVARTDVPAAVPAVIRRLIGQEGTPPSEITLPVEFLEAMKEQMAVSMRQMQEAAKDGKVPPGDLPPEMELFAALDLDGIQGLIMDPSGKVAVVPRNVAPALTDAAGRFELQGLDPGTYRVIFSANGFVRQDYGQRGWSDGTPVQVNAGAAVENVTARMVPTGMAYGRVLNSAGQPVAAAIVQLMRTAYDATGKKKARPILSARTNDRGEYRFYYLTPGRYYVSAGGADRTNEYPPEALLSSVAGSLPSSNRVTDQRYSLSYYPGTPDLNAAVPIDIISGGAVSDINIAVTAQGVYTVRGSVIDPAGGGPAPSVSIRLTTPDGEPGLPGVTIRPQTNYKAADGSFELRNVPSGAYMLTVEMQNRSAAPPQPPRPAAQMSEAEQRAYIEAQRAASMAQAAQRLRASIPITVDSDIDGLLVAPGVGSSFDGRIRVEGTAEGRTVKVERLMAEFRPVNADGAPARSGLNMPQSQQAKDDGTFRVTTVFSGQYWLRVRNLPTGFYVKSASFGELDALNRPIALPLTDGELKLEIVISPNLAQVDGRATADGKPVSGGQVVLIPDRNRERAELFRSVNADAAGRFAITDVEPGDYHVGVWPFLEPFGYFDPELIKQAQEKGKAIRVAESSRQQIDVEALPAP
jgi:hypothetical protein